MSNTNKNITLKALAAIEKLSSSTIHVCKENKLVDLNTIMAHYQEHGSFYKLRKSNSQINRELLDVCNKYSFDNDRIDNLVQDSDDINWSKNKEDQKASVKDFLSLSLKELTINENLSVRATNLCKDADLLYLDDILNFYKAHDNFFKLRNCGKKTNAELINICKKYPSSTKIATVDSKGIFEKVNKQIDELFTNHLPTTAKEVISAEVKYNLTFDTLYKIGFFKQNYQPGLISNITSNAKRDIFEFKNKIIKIVKDAELCFGIVLIDNTRDNITNQINQLTSNQIEILNYFINSKIELLSNRAKNALLKFLEYNTTLQNINKLIYANKGFVAKNIRNVGEQTRKEIETFLIDLKKNINEDVSMIPLEDHMIHFSKMQLEKHFKLSEKDFYESGIVDIEIKEIFIFKMIYYLIEHGCIYSDQYEFVFNNSKYRENNNRKNLTKIGIEINLSKERVRQMQDTIQSSIYKTFSFIVFFKNICLKRYNIDLNEKYLNINYKEIINSENIDFSERFINLIIHIITREKFTLIGTEYTLAGKKKKNKYKWKKSYLINKELIKFFNVEKMVFDIDLRLSERITESYELNFQAYLMNFIKNENLNKIYDIVQIAEHVLVNEFELILDHEDNIVFNRNTHKPINEYIYEILEEANKPLKIDEIFETLNRQYPDISNSKISLQSSCRNDSRTIFFGRSSTYGLKIWEKEYENIRGGTMRDITEEFLMQFNEPKHIDEIVLYVCKYRENVKTRNLFTNLKIAENKRFVFFNNKHIGLVSKSYDNSIYKAPPEKSINKRTWEENYKALETFFHTNKRLPYSTGNIVEIQLYRFFYFQVKKLSELNDTKKEQIESFMLKSNYKKGARRTKSKPIKPINHTELNRSSHNVISIKDIYIIDYSEKEIAIYGNTKPIKEILSTLGCRYNRYLTINDIVTPGWIASIKLKKEIAEFLINLKQ